MIQLETGKLFYWTAYERYYGVAKVLDSGYETIYGDDFNHSFMSNGVLCYSDADREVSHLEIKDNDLLVIAKKYNMHYKDADTLEIAESRLTEEEIFYIENFYDTEVVLHTERISFDTISSWYEIKLK